MNAKALSLRNMNEPNQLVAAYEQAQHALIVAEAISLGLTIHEVTDRPGQNEGEVLVGCEIEGTADQLVDMFRGLADKQVFGWYAVEMGEEARKVRSEDDWGMWYDDMVDEPLMKFTVELPKRKKTRKVK